MEEAVAALLGALVGGFSTGLAAAWVSRRDVARKHRIDTYRDTLPPLLERTTRIVFDLADGKTYPFGGLRYEFAPLVRESIIAGRRDAKFGDQILDLVSELDLSDPWQSGSQQGVEGDAVAEMAALQLPVAEDLWKALRSYEDYLERKIR